MSVVKVHATRLLIPFTIVVTRLEFGRFCVVHVPFGNIYTSSTSVSQTDSSKFYHSKEGRLHVFTVIVLIRHNHALSWFRIWNQL